MDICRVDGGKAHCDCKVGYGLSEDQKSCHGKYVTVMTMLGRLVVRVGNTRQETSGDKSVEQQHLVLKMEHLSLIIIIMITKQLNFCFCCYCLCLNGKKYFSIFKIFNFLKVF